MLCFIFFFCSVEIRIVEDYILDNEEDNNNNNIYGYITTLSSNSKMQL